MAAVTQKYIAKVTDNQDDEKRGRIKVICPDFLGSDDTPISTWIEPALDWGWFYIPDVDELVEIEIVVSHHTDNHYGQSKIWDPDIKWRGTRFWGGTKDTTDAPRPIPNIFRDTNYGKRRGFATPCGHVIMFDDTEGKEKINIMWSRTEGEEIKVSYLSFNEDGSIIVGNKTGSIIFMDAKNGAMSIIDEHGNTYSTDSEGMKLIDKTGNIIELKDGVVQILGQSAFTVSCKDAHIQGEKVILAEDVEPAVLGDQWKIIHDGHIHPTGTGPSGPPTPGTPIPSSTALSAKVSLE
jgi:hypothetical protein